MGGICRVDLRIILRDENTELMDEFLTNGGRSIPKLVRLNENFEVLEPGARVLRH